MPRPLRIEFENAHYHVMNRSVAGRSIFYSPECYQAFLDILGEASTRYGLVIHAYFLAHNQFHLLIKTPRGNLSRVMRHINGVYTQRYNRVNDTDGPLFKGRFKAVLVEYGDALLKLSQYIHDRPMVIKKPVVKHLIDYQWSSYPAYIGKAAPLNWLSQDTLFAMLECEDKAQGYANYMSSGIGEEVLQWYGKSHLPSVIGSKNFKASLSWPTTDSVKPSAHTDLTIIQVISGVADFYDVATDEITQMIRGPQKVNYKRKVAMYLCQELADAKLTQLANEFNLGHMRSASHTTYQVRQWIKEDSEFKQQVEHLIKHIQQYRV
ncbi:MAG: putative transposase [Phenylobacterium sp.]|jgi:putative transposase